MVQAPSLCQWLLHAPPPPLGSGSEGLQECLPEDFMSDSLQQHCSDRGLPVSGMGRFLEADLGSHRRRVLRGRQKEVRQISCHGQGPGLSQQQEKGGPGKEEQNTSKS